MSKCVLCGVEFEGYGRARFCSGACRVKSHRGVTIGETNVTDVTIGRGDVTIDGNEPCNVTKKPEGYLDLEKDLGLDMRRDLGINAWTKDGIFIRPDISIEQVRRIRRLVEAKHGWEAREYT